MASRTVILLLILSAIGADAAAAGPLPPPTSSPPKRSRPGFLGRRRRRKRGGGQQQRGHSDPGRIPSTPAGGRHIEPVPEHPRRLRRREGQPRSGEFLRLYRRHVQRILLHEQHDGLRRTPHAEQIRVRHVVVPVSSLRRQEQLLPGVARKDQGGWHRSHESREHERAAPAVRVRHLLDDGRRHWGGKHPPAAGGVDPGDDH